MWQVLEVSKIPVYKKAIMALSDGGKLYRTELALVLCAEDMWDQLTSLNLLHPLHPHAAARKAVRSPIMWT